jgi:hypothetical protein
VDLVGIDVSTVWCIAAMKKLGMGGSYYFTNMIWESRLLRSDELFGGLRSFV